MEQHSEAWTQRVLQYLTACEPFTRSSLVQPPVFAEPPLLPALPKPKWLLAVYTRDVLWRLHEVKAKITSVLGCVLKMDSTKKVSALFISRNLPDMAAEGHGLDPMAIGLMKRYRDAGEAAPKVMYMDRDCCNQHGQSRVKVMFLEWDELEGRLDICHFMRRFAAGVTTEAHPLYRIFMARLSACIFLWDPEDVAAVTSQKGRSVLALPGGMRNGKDTLGVPLLDHEWIQHIWKEQQKHRQCVQNPENFPLYMKTGTLKKGGVELCCYRCARGSTSLESIHLHLNRFIPGTSASDAHFQAYLLEGLMHWNDDRMEDAIKGASSIRSYGSAMREAVDQLSRTVLGKSWDERYCPPGAFTGELLGIEYLYSQTGRTLTPVFQNPEDEDRLLEEVDDQDLQDEGFDEEIMEDSSSASPASLAEPSTSFGEERQHLAPAPSVLSQPSITGSSLSDEAQGAAIGPDGIAGWDKVQDLAGYLVGLREAPYLTDLQVTEVIQLWTALPDTDKQRINYQPRHQPQLTHGRFKAPKRSRVTPGVESGLLSPDPIAVANTQLPPPREKLDEAPSTSGPKHPFILPLNQEGQAPILQPGRRPAATRECPNAPAPTVSGVVQPSCSAPGALLGTLVLNPDMTLSVGISSSGASTSGAGPAPPAPASDAPVSRYTQRNRRWRALEMESGVHKRKYVSGVTFNMCSKCGQPKTKEF
ncbi:hypothetical protein QQF64_034588 [Cirrhinus molitorella]|uniref:DUF6729 domain-containing protein n=1 Tax=Cirrhinus molitorella TaxID=172907 RepID=A0ABR3L4T7_9TELE